MWLKRRSGVMGLLALLAYLEHSAQQDNHVKRIPTQALIQLNPRNAQGKKGGENYNVCTSALIFPPRFLRQRGRKRDKKLGKEKSVVM